MCLLYLAFGVYRYAVCAVDRGFLVIIIFIIHFIFIMFREILYGGPLI